MFNKKLKLFQRNEDSIWTDEHISKELLKCHLNEFTDGASRKLAKRNKILKLINNNIPKNSKILDLGYGPGLFDLELGKLGHRVLGIDFNVESINYATKNKKSKNVEYSCVNYLKNMPNEKYDAILMIYCDFGVLIPSEQVKLLKNIYDILKDHGAFIFDVFNLESKNLKISENYWNISGGNDFWCKDPYLFLHETEIFYEKNAVGERYFIVNQKNFATKEFILWNQYYCKDSIRKLMSDNDFSIIDINENLIDDENTMFVIAKKL